MQGQARATKSERQRSIVLAYVVQPGDTLSGIADAFGASANGAVFDGRKMNHQGSQKDHKEKARKPIYRAPPALYPLLKRYDVPGQG